MRNSLLITKAQIFCIFFAFSLLFAFKSASAAVPTISYTPSSYTLTTGSVITAITPAVTNSPLTYAVSSGTLPAGLTLNLLTGVITGTPTAIYATATITVSATNLSGSGNANITFTVNPPVPVISYSPSTNVYTTGTAITSLTPSNTGGAVLVYSIGTTLPAGLSFSTVTGVISGTPTAITATTIYTITATNAGGSGHTTVTLTVNAPPPVITYSPSTYIYTTGTAITSLTPANTGGAAVTYSINTALPAGLSFSTSTGVISGTPTVTSTATTYTFTATNTGGSANTMVTITVNPPPPSISYSPSTNTYVTGTAISPLMPTNTGGAIVSYSISTALPAGLSFSTSTGVISGTPTVATVATTYTITATNAGGSGSTTVNLTVNPLPPVISYSPSSHIYQVGTAITSISPTNTGGAAASYSIGPALPAGLSLNTTTGVISGNPTAEAAINTYTVTATNAGGTGSTSLTLTVNPKSPVISYSPSTNIFNVGTAVTLTPTNTGGIDTSFSIGPSLPAGLSFNTSTGVISGTPTAVSPSTNYIVSGDNNGGTSTTTVTISCVNPSAPVISYSPSTNVYTTGTAITSLTPSNSGGAASGYSISTSLPAGLSFNTTTGVISGNPTTASPATTYTITATNAGGSGTTTVNLTVNPTKPVISYSPSTNAYTVGTAISPLTPNNTGGAASGFSISATLPAGLAFSTSTGVISGTPTTTFSATTYTITATNANGSGTTTVTLSASHNAPAITYSPGTVTYSVGSPISPATPTNTGGTPTGYTISATLPTGLSFNTSTGVISGTPTVVFSTTTFTITATNTAGTSSASLIITVSPHAPVISYTPSTNAYPVGAAIATLAPTNTGGAVTGYSYSSTGTALTGATLSGPSLMTIDASGNIYVANYSNKTVSRWNSSHTYLGTYTTGKTLTNPEGIVFDSSGNSYVEDTGAGAIYKFNSSGAYVSTIISGLSHPLGISIDASNNLYIATYVYTSPYTSSVTKYSTTGTLLQTFPNANMNESDGVAVDQSSGIVYVLNRGNNITGTNKGTVTYYSASGTYLGVFSSGYSDPLAISVDPSGNVFVADSHNDEVKIYSSSGVLLNTLTGFTDVEGFVADANGNLYVSDFTDNTVKEYLSLGGYHINAPLPPGLSFNSTNGQITGTPTGVFPATTYTVTAYNITGSGSTMVTISCYTAYDWIGVTSTDWNTPSNWVSNTVPTSSNQAVIGVNRTFNYFPNILTSDGTVNVGSIACGNMGGKSPGVNVNSGGILNVAGTITYQSDANATAGYSCLLSGAGTLNTDSISVIANTALSSSYTATMASSVTNLNVTTNIAITSSNSGALLYNAAFNITGGTTALTGIVQTTNTAASTSSLVIIPASTATLQIANTTALSGLSSTGTNVVTLNNSGATVQYSGASQTVYSDAAITGLPGGVSYWSTSFTGTGIKTITPGNLNISGDFTDALANDAGDYIKTLGAIINFNGTTQNLAGGGGNGFAFYNINFSGAGTKTMNSGKFTLVSVLTMVGNNSATILNANGLLYLQSNSNGSANIAPIAAGPSIIGNVNVQRYLTGGSGYRNYRLASSPVYQGAVSSNNVYSINYLQNSMYLTGSGGGFDKVGNPTLYLFREDKAPSNTTFTSGNFWGLSTINNTPNYNYGVTGGGTTGNFNIPVGDGFMFFFRGNRTSASLATETQPSYTTPVTVTTVTTGVLNQGQITAKNWYTPTSSYLGYTGSGTGTNYAVRGFNLVGNPYASSIDWESYNTSSTTTGIYASNIGITVYELNPETNNYDVYQKGGVYTGHGKRTIVSGQGFFILATGSNPQLLFNETAKTTAQNTGLSLFMTTQQDVLTLNNTHVDQHLRLQVAMDSVNTDDIYIGFNSGASSKFVNDEDAPYKTGNGKIKIASFSTDSVRLAINRMPLPGLQQAVIPLFVTAADYGTYSLNLTELKAIPQLYDVWLMDKFKKDSLDMRHNSTYAFDITTDTTSYGNNRFQLVLRQNAALMVHLLNFTGSKVTNGAQMVWVTENEENFTNFTIERSADGTSFNDLGGYASSAQGTYSFIDQSPAQGANLYRLKMVDLNGTITYSNIVTLMYGSAASLVKNGIIVYPNPAASTINLNILPGFTSTSNSAIKLQAAPSNLSYNIQITNILGAIITKSTTNNQNWQADVNNLIPGTYIIKVINSKDNSTVGQSTFVKL